jgi:hypothetical protein
MQEIAVEPDRRTTRFGLLHAQAIHRAALPSATYSNEGWLNGQLIANERASALLARQLLVTLEEEAVAGELSGVGAEVSEAGVEVAGEADAVPT